MNKINEIKKDVTMTRTDKGQTLVAIKCMKYINKTEDFLNSGNLTFKTDDPTEKYQNKN